MIIENAEQLDRAIKRAIKDSGREVGNAYRGMLRDRFLCRVFSGGSDTFVLKGGSGLLARIPDARATRDIDFAAATREPAEDILRELNALIEINLNDFVLSSSPKVKSFLTIMVTQGFSNCVTLLIWAIKRKILFLSTFRLIAQLRYSPNTCLQRTGLKLKA